MTKLCEKIWNHMADPNNQDMVQTALEGGKPELAIEMLKLLKLRHIDFELEMIRKYLQGKDEEIV